MGFTEGGGHPGGVHAKNIDGKTAGEDAAENPVQHKHVFRERT